MLRTVYQSSIMVFDLQNVLKKKSRKKLYLGFKSFMVDCPLAFFFLLGIEESVQPISLFEKCDF